MRIANPKYDAVFRYLFEDTAVANLLLSALLGWDLTTLTPSALEPRPGFRPSTLVARVAFTSMVRDKDGSTRPALILIRKARNPADLLRYLSNPWVPCPPRKSGANRPWGSPPGTVHAEAPSRPAYGLPQLTLDFLVKSQGLNAVPVLWGTSTITDAATGDEIPNTVPFLEDLTPAAILVQMDQLKGRRRTELEQLLMIFDQGLTEPGNPQFLEVREEDCPMPYRDVLFRLIRAQGEKRVLDGIDVEDIEWNVLVEKDRRMADQAMRHAPGA